MVAAKPCFTVAIEDAFLAIRVRIFIKLGGPYDLSKQATGYFCD
jgi:hypothetical protein